MTKIYITVINEELRCSTALPDLQNNKDIEFDLVLQKLQINITFFSNIFNSNIENDFLMWLRMDNQSYIRFSSLVHLGNLAMSSDGLNYLRFSLFDDLNCQLHYKSDYKLYRELSNEFEVIEMGNLIDRLDPLGIQFQQNLRDVRQAYQNLKKSFELQNNKSKRVFSF